MMKSIKNFPPEAVLTVYTDTMLCDDFDGVHDCFNHVIGAPLPAHFLRHPVVLETCRARIAEQVPNVADGCAVLAEHGTVSAGNIDVIVGDIKACLGKSVPLAKGSGYPTPPMPSIRK